MKVDAADNTVKAYRARHRNIRAMRWLGDWDAVGKWLGAEAQQWRGELRLCGTGEDVNIGDWILYDNIKYVALPDRAFRLLYTEPE